MTIESALTNAMSWQGFGYVSPFVDTPVTHHGANINTVGQIPAISPIVQDNAIEKNIFGEKAALERSHGKLRASTRISHATDSGVVFKTEAYAFPEAKWKTLLTWEELEQALSMHQ